VRRADFFGLGARTIACGTLEEMLILTNATATISWLSFQADSGRRGSCWQYSTWEGNPAIDVPVKAT
jgi:hypothetical protein